MKKVIAALTLILAFSINANAQKKAPIKQAAPKEVTTAVVQKVSAAEAGKSEANELSKYLGLNETQTNDFTRLLEQKHRTLEENLTPERKKELSKVIEAKIRASLDANQTDKLEKNKELFNKLIN
jgi:hypothetical protein